MKKQPAMIAICAALLVCVAAAGCTSSTSSSPNASATANSSSQAATASATPTPTPTPTPPPTHLTVLFFYEPDCPYCQALESTTSFHQLENTSQGHRDADSELYKHADRSVQRDDNPDADPAEQRPRSRALGRSQRRFCDQCTNSQPVQSWLV